MVTENLKDNKLLSYFDKYVIIPYYSFKHFQNPRYKNTLNKFYMYNFIEYDKLFFLDADVFLLNNVDKYFDLAKDIEFVGAAYSPIRFKQEYYFPTNAAMIITPCPDTF
jgi:alpha-N-acetylglucosamine transferase